MENKQLWLLLLFFSPYSTCHTLQTSNTPESCNCIPPIEYTQHAQNTITFQYFDGGQKILKIMPHNFHIHRSHFGPVPRYMTSLLFRVKSSSALSDICQYCYFWTSVDAASHCHFVFCCQSTFFCSSSAASLLLVPAVSEWVDMCYFQQCSLSARSMRSFCRDVMLFELYVDMLLASHTGLALRVVIFTKRKLGTRYQRLQS